MKRKEGKLLLGVLIAVVALGIGYATISGVNLLINGTSSIKAAGGDFKVRFVKNIASETAIENPVDNAILMSGKNADETDMAASNLSASITDDTTATFTVNEMHNVGDYATFTYTVVNESDGIDAMLSFDVADSNDAQDYFKITKNVNKAIIGENETSTVTVRVELTAAPKLNDVEATFSVTLTASPVEEEDTSSSITGTTQEVTSASSFAKAIQNDNIDTIVLDSDVTIDKNANLTIDDDTTIEFNGNTLTVQPGSIKVADGAVLTLEDESEEGGITAAKDAVTVESGGEVVVESGNYQTTEFSGRGAVITIPAGTENAKITINGGTITGEYFAISSWGNGEVEINGGDISSNSSSVLDKVGGNAYYAYAVKVTDGHLEMNGGSVTGVHGGIAIEGTATATINGGSVTLNTTTSTSNDAYYCFYLDEQGSLEVLDGTFTNNGTRSLVYTSSSELVNLRGGNWTGKSTYPFNNKVNGAVDLIKIYGGTFKKNTSGTLTDYNVSSYNAN